MERPCGPQLHFLFLSPREDPHHCHREEAPKEVHGEDEYFLIFPTSTEQQCGLLPCVLNASGKPEEGLP